MSEALQSVLIVIERSDNADYMSGSSSDKYLNIPSSNSNENRSSFEGFKK